VTILWIVDLVTLVPYGIYYLLFHAQRDQYALQITLVLFWIFGFWGVMGPILGAIKIRRFFKALENAQSAEKLKELLESRESQDTVFDLIAVDNGIPKFLARKIYFMAVRKFSDVTGAPQQAIEADNP